MLLSSCDRGIGEYVGVSDISSEIELILARASTFSFLVPRNISAWTVCPAHPFSLRIGWRGRSH